MGCKQGCAAPSNWLRRARACAAGGRGREIPGASGREPWNVHRSKRKPPDPLVALFSTLFRLDVMKAPGGGCATMPEQPNADLEIFAGALECATPDERAAYLASACGGDAELRTRVEALLQAH